MAFKCDMNITGKCPRLTLDFNYIPYMYISSGRLTILSKIKSEPDYIIAVHAFVKAMLRLELQATRGARN